MPSSALDGRARKCLHFGPVYQEVHLRRVELYLESVRGLAGFVDCLRGRACRPVDDLVNRRIISAVIYQVLPVLPDEKVEITLIRRCEIGAGDDESITFGMC